VGARVTVEANRSSAEIVLRIIGMMLVVIPFFLSLPVVLEVPWRIAFPQTGDSAYLALHAAIMAELAFKITGTCMVMLFGIALLVVPPLSLGSLRAIPWKLRTESPAVPMAQSRTEDGIEPA
jgi:hypothetical protein